MSVTDAHAPAGPENGGREPSAGMVQLRPDGLRVEATFSTETLIDFVRDEGLGDDPVRGLEDLLVIGVLSSRTGSGYAVASEARRAEAALRTMFMTEAEAHIRAAIVRAIESNGDEGGFLPEIDRVVTTATRTFESLSERLVGELKGSSESALPQVLERRVRASVRDVVEGILEAVFSAEGVLATKLAGNTEALSGIRVDLMRLQEVLLRTIAASEEDDPAKAGRDWQPATLQEIARLTHVTGDRLEETGDTPGPGRSKRGDGVLHLACGNGEAGPRVAIECRTGSQIVTLRDLTKAKTTRSADAALLITERAAALPRDAQALGFRIYPDDSIVVVQHDVDRADAAVLLATAVQVARFLAQLAAGVSATAVDLDMIRVVVRRIESCLGRLKPLRGSVTGIETEAGRIRGYLQDIEREARSAVGELAGLGPNQ